MNTYETELGYIVRETLGGLEVSENDRVVCTISGRTLDSYRTDPDDDLSDIDDDLLEADIKDEIEVEEFIAYQEDYC
jgi:hypothetical protein